MTEEHPLRAELAFWRRIERQRRIAHSCEWIAALAIAAALTLIAAAAVSVGHAADLGIDPL